MNKIYFFIGTKAQAIKCLPLMETLSEFDDCNIIFVNSGQHKSIVSDVMSKSTFSYREIKLYKNKDDITKYVQAFVWLFSFTFLHLIKKNNKIDPHSNNLCVIHGDTLSTLMGGIWAKRNSIKLVHLESGLTSNRLLIPFPEEIVRRIVAKISNVLISFDKDSFNRLSIKYRKKSICYISENTIIETLGNNLNFDNTNTVTVTLHRTENLFSKRNFQKFVDLLNSIPEKYKITWYLHEPTENFLNRYKPNLSKNITTSKLLGHDDFIEKIKKSSFVITDGGSIQEECYYLGKNTIIWRNTTERPFALNKNMLISNYSVTKSQKFLLKYIDTNYKPKETVKPSEEIIKYFRNNNILK